MSGKVKPKKNAAKAKKPAAKAKPTVAKRPAAAARKPAPAKKAPAKPKAAEQKAPKAAASKAPAAKAAKAEAPVKAEKAAPEKAKIQAAAKPAPEKTVKPALAAEKKEAPVKAAVAVAAVPVKARPPVTDGVESRMTVKKPAPRSEFKTGEHIVYPAHGVGRIVGVDSQEVAGIKLDLFVISFIKDKMTLRVPVMKATSVGMRKLADAPTVKRALETVRGRARIKRTMWSRRAQEYEAKINSGDLISIAEVVRDLYRSDNQPEQSYSERQLYEAALDRMSREISSVSRISETEAIRQIEQNLAKSPRRNGKPEAVETREEAA